MCRRRWVCLNALVATIRQQMVLQRVARVYRMVLRLLYSLAVLFRRAYRHDPQLRFKDGPVEGAYEGHVFLELVGNEGVIQ